jgi:hypothetical protein
MCIINDQVSSTYVHIHQHSSERCSAAQGCQMVYFKTKNPNLGTFWRVLQWKMLVYLMPLGQFSCHLMIYCMNFGIICGNLGYFPPFWYTVPRKIWQPCCRDQGLTFPTSNLTPSRRDNRTDNLETNESSPA